MSKVIRRGLFHILGGLSIAITGLFIPSMTFLILLGIATAIFLVAEFLRFRVPGINQWFCRRLEPVMREYETTRLTGSTYMVVAALITFLAFPKDVAVVAISFLAVGDPMGTMVGRHLGKVKLRRKTLEGCLSCLVSSIAAGLIFYYAGLDVRLSTVLTGAFVATIVEAIELPVNDNLAIPLSSGAVMTMLQLWV